MYGKENQVTLILLCVCLLAGCAKDDDKDIHYKPSEYKHNIEISKANRIVDDIENEILAFGKETSVDIMIETYNDSLGKLNTHLVKLEETKKLLKDDSDLTNAERKSWENSYESAINNVNNCMKNIETKKNKIYE